MHIGAECGARGGSSHMLRRQDRREGVFLEPGADVGEHLDLLDGDVGLARALVAQPELLAPTACRRWRRELQEAIKGVPRTQRGCFSLSSTASSAPPESSPILAHIGPIGQDTTQAARFLDRAVVLPERHELHEKGKEDTDDAVEAQGGVFCLMVEMGKSGLTSQGKSHACGLRAAQAAVPECAARPGATGGHIGLA
eukprot:scaffold100852_cov66-Phaeocystis_antarctica.AAC.3